MGGKNESVLKADLQPRGEILRADERIKEKKKSKKEKKKKDPLSSDAPAQTQNIRQHLNGGEIHFHDDDGGLKTAIPVAEWYTGIKAIRSMQDWRYVDPANKTIAAFHPFLHGDVADVTITLQEITIGSRLAALSDVTK